MRPLRASTGPRVPTSNPQNTRTSLPALSALTSSDDRCSRSPSHSGWTIQSSSGPLFSNRKHEPLATSLSFRNPAVRLPSPKSCLVSPQLLDIRISGQGLGPVPGLIESATSRMERGLRTGAHPPFADLHFSIQGRKRRGTGERPPSFSTRFRLQGEEAGRFAVCPARRAGRLDARSLPDLPPMVSGGHLHSPALQTRHRRSAVL